MTFVAIGGFSFLLGAASLLLIRDRPTDMGFAPVNPTEAGPKIGGRELLHAVGGALRSRGIWPAMAISGLYSGGQLAFTGAWGVPWLTSVYGLTRAEASGVVSLVVLGAMIGAVLIGRLTDMAGARRWPLALTAAVNVAAWGVILFWGSGRPPMAVLKPALFVMGVASMAFLVCLAVAKEINSPRYTGVAVSVLNTGTFLGAALYPPAMGFMIDILQGYPPVTQYRGALALCLAGAVAGLCLVLKVPETHCRNITLPRAGEE